MHDPQRRHLLQASLLLATCTAWRPARACEYFAPTLRITHPWTRATPADAAHAVLCMRIDEVTQADRLLAVHTPVAERVLTGRGAAEGALPLDIPAGQDLLMSETGLHLRLLGLRQPLEIARSYPLTLVFERGGSVNAAFNVDYMRFA